MSFYGQVLYEFKKLFNTFNFNNSNNTSTDNITLSEGTIVPTLERDKINWKTGNHWLGFNCDDKSNTITLYHNAPSNDIKEEFSSQGFTPSNKVLANAEDLQAGQYFSTSTSTFDKAGHIVETITKTYRLPMSETEKDISDIKANLEEADKRLTDLEDFNNDIDATYTKQKDFNELVGSVTEYVTTIAPSTYATIEETGLPSDIYSTKSGDEMPSLSITIGKVDGNNGYSTHIATLTNNADKDAIYDVSTSIISLVEYIQGLETRIKILEKLVTAE